MPSKYRPLPGHGFGYAGTLPLEGGGHVILNTAFGNTYVRPGGFYNGQHVVVTGGAGMIGYQLVRLLREAGAEVSVLDSFSRGRNKVKGVWYQPKGDAADPHSCEYAFRRPHGPDVFAVFNLAAKVAGVQYNLSHHHEMYLENSRLQTMPVAVAEKVGVPHFLQVSSVCVYSPNHNHPAVERNGMVAEPHPANAGYSWAKRMGEQAVLWSNLDHAVIVRPSNVFGPHDYYDEKAHVIPNLIKKVLEPGDTITMFSPPTITREFIYAEDVAQGMMAALEYGDNKAVYNIGTNGDTCVSLEELLATIQALAGTTKTVVWQGHDPRSAGDPARYSDASRLNALGWTHQTHLVKGLDLVIKEYRERINT